MNYLAHAYLSFKQPEILVGNMISDFVKGKQKLIYNKGIQDGIQLHRNIDAFTDAHPATLEAKKVFQPYVRLYAGAFVDIIYDHFLALDQKERSEEAWLLFSRETYATLDEYANSLPERFSQMLYYMQRDNWLFNYRYRWGIQNSFEGLIRRAKYLTDDRRKPVFKAFEQEYATLRDCYEKFFPCIKSFVINHQLLKGSR